MEGNVHKVSERVPKTMGIWVHTYSSGGWGSRILKKSSLVCLVLHKETQKYRGVETPVGHTLSQDRAAFGRPCPQTLPWCIHSSRSLSWRRRGPQPCATGTPGETVDGSAGPWPLRPRTPGFHGFRRQRKVLAPDPYGLGLSWRHPTLTRILSYCSSIPKFFYVPFSYNENNNNN